MKNSNLVKWLVCILFSMLIICGIGIAYAEEEVMGTAQLELFSEGGFPHDQPMLVSMFGINSFEEFFVAELHAQSAEINISSYNMTREEFDAEAQRIINYYPDLFFVNGSFPYYYNPTTNIVSRVCPVYKYTGSTLESMKAIYENGISEIVSYARAADTDVGRMLRASDYMCINYEYDESLQIRSPELMFQNNTGVCQAYMLIYRAVLNELGIPNISLVSDEINHTWNLVYRDGDWYHTDVTWNDPITDVPLRACHGNFLLSDEGITATGHHGWDDGFEEYPTATNTKYDNYFWRDLDQASCMYGDKVYYIESDHSTDNCSVYTFDLESECIDHICSFTYGGGYYIEGSDPLWVVGDTIYYAVRDSLYSMDMNGANKTLVYNTGNPEHWLMYPYLFGSTLKICAYNVFENYAGDIHSCPISLKYAIAIEPYAVRTDIGSTVQLSAVITPSNSGSIDIVWSSSNEAVATVDENGKVTAINGGIVEINAAIDDTTTAVCTVIVNAEEMMYLPADTILIDAEAFMNTAAGMVDIPNGVTTIGSKAFANNNDLIMVVIPESVSIIAPDAFIGSDNVTLLCVANSKGEEFAIANSIPYVILSAP